MDSRLIKVSEISNRYGLRYEGEDRAINAVSNSKNCTPDSITWAKNCESLAIVSNGCVVCKASDWSLINPNVNVTYLIASTPRLQFAKIIFDYFNESVPDYFENHVSYFKERADLTIGENVFIGKHVNIGEGTIIHHNSIVYSGTVIGKNCELKNHCSIGTEGLGLEFDPETKLYFKFPQIGNVIIEDNVEIGPYSTIRRSALGETIIKKGTKLGSYCNIGHNTSIGENCLLTSNVIIAGSSHIKNNVYIGVSTNIRNGVTVGNNSTIGQGSVITKNIPDNEVWFGNPAKKIK
jgi:UDP-3-O-[3-hydroxymyristoyl] glucosamine N-acyltransferase